MACLIFFHLLECRPHLIPCASGLQVAVSVRERVVLEFAAFDFSPVLSEHCMFPSCSLRVQHFWCSWRQESGAASPTALHTCCASVRVIGSRYVQHRYSYTQIL